MKSLFAATLTVILCSQWGAAQSADLAEKLGYPQMIVHNGKIVTMDDASFQSQVGTIVQAMAIRDGKILATGSNNEIRAMAGQQTRMIDVKGRTVLPGFISTHEHPTDWAFLHPRAITHVLPDDEFLIHRWLPNLPLQEQWAKFVPTMKEALAKAKPGQWILLGFNLHGDNTEERSGMNRSPIQTSGIQEPFDFKKNITKKLLDQLAPNNPVKVKSGSNHSVINQKAIEESRKVHPTLSVISGNSENSTPAFSQWLESGYGFNRPIEPNVMFRDNLPALAEILKAEMELWASWGITTFGSSPYAYRNLQAFNYLDQQGEMPGRFGWAYTGPDWSEETLRYLGSILGNGTDHLWLIGAWGRAGGSCMSIPSQEGAAAGDRSECFTVFHPGGKFRERTELVIKSGLRIATMYSSGDKDIDYLMDAIEEASKAGGFSLEEIRAKRHTFDGGRGAPRPEQISRMKRLGMMATLYNKYLDSGPRQMAERYGIEYANWVVPRMSLTRAGVMTSNSIDLPLPREVFRLFLKGMNRYDEVAKKVYGPRERTDRIIQLKAWTRWGAYYMLRENLLGTLEPGKFADFIVIDKDLLTIPDDQIPTVRVLMTAVGGKIVHLTVPLANQVGMQPIGPTTWKEKIPPGW